MAKKTKPQPDTEQRGKKLPPGAIRLKLAWRNAENQGAIFADNLHLRRVNEQYYLTFGQIIPPIELDDRASEITAEIGTVSRIVVTADTLKKMVKLLSEKLERAEG